VKSSIIALLTDFGDQDFFVASMKGVIAGIHPGSRIIDITHRVPSHDVDAAGFILFAVCGYFPAGTVFLTVVDPGVGTDRRILLAEAAERFFIAPDNGVLSRVLDRGNARVRRIIPHEFSLSRVGRTFEGRDVMAPAAARLAAGAAREEFGPVIVDYKRRPAGDADERRDRVTGRIVYQDKFGNMITNITEETAGRFARRIDRPVVIRASERSIPAGEGYTSVGRGEALFVTGSLGYLEIAVREGSAAERLGMRVGDSVDLVPVPLKEKET